MNIFEMLMLSRKLAFEDGRVTLYGQGIAIFPTPSLAEHLAQMSNDPASTKLVYRMAKESMLDSKQDLINAHNASKDKNWLCEMINLYAHGAAAYEDPAKEGVIILADSPFSSSLTGKVNGPVDHIVRGLIAGIASAISNKDIDVLEIECGVDGKCKFTLGEKKNLMSKYPSIGNSQI